MIRVLRSLIITPSPAQKVASWLLHDTVPPYHILTQKPTYAEIVKRQAVRLYRSSSAFVHPSEQEHSPPTLLLLQRRILQIPHYTLNRLTRHPRNAIPPTSRPQTTRSRAVLTPQPLTAPDILTSIPPPKKLSIPRREHPSPPKSLPTSQQLLLDRLSGTYHYSRSLTPAIIGMVLAAFPMRAPAEVGDLFKSSPSSSVSVKGDPRPSRTTDPLDREVSKITSRELNFQIAGYQRTIRDVDNTPSSHGTPRPTACVDRVLGAHYRLSGRDGPFLVLFNPLVDVDAHSNKRVMSPASRIEDYELVVWLQTGVSSGNRPTLN